MQCAGDGPPAPVCSWGRRSSGAPELCASGYRKGGQRSSSSLVMFGIRLETPIIKKIQMIPALLCASKINIAFFPQWPLRKEKKRQEAERSSKSC